MTYSLWGLLLATILTTSCLPDSVSVILFANKEIRSVQLKLNNPSDWLYPGGLRYVGVVEIEVISDSVLELRSGHGELLAYADSVEVSNAEFLAPKQVRYDGRISITIKDGDISVVNTVPTNSYLASTVASESNFDEIEVLKAQAVLSRTFVALHLGNHAPVADFCDLTHCMAYKGSDVVDSDVVYAVESTDGFVLRCGRSLTEPFFSSSNGGHTAVPSEVWGLSPSSDICYSFRTDPFSKTSENPHRKWATLLSLSEIGRLFDDEGRLVDVIVVERSVGGYAKRMELLFADGHRLTVSASDFATAVNRELGWNKVKSLMFRIVRTASDTITLIGSGLGHGVGLSQYGALELAHRGADFRKILHFYFNGSEIDRMSCTAHFQIFSDEQLDFRLGDALEAALADVRRVTCLNPVRRIVVIATSSVEEYQRITKVQWWKAAVTFNDTIVLQPIGVLERKGILWETLRREVFHALIFQNGLEMPVWLQEGLATLAFGHCGEPTGKLMHPNDVEKLLNSNKLDEFKKGWCEAAWLAMKLLGDRSICQFLESLRHSNGQKFRKFERSKGHEI
ncbi:MAG: hypothetical protein DRQ10_01070 [Candidatus Hydrothermota bacterium]|nr:MAG: hypothetical protein DRQ10_01070 [Candidatus Hydrothermae bacterium]